MHNSPRPSRSFIVGVIVVAVLVLGARIAVAEAATYCVQDPACPAGGVAEASLAAAAEAAGQDPGFDTIQIGPGTFPSPSLIAPQSVAIVGAGIDRTVLEDQPGETGANLYLKAGSSASDLTVRLVEGGQVGIRLAGGADLTRVGVTAPHEPLVNSGIIVEDPGSVIDSAVVDLGRGMSGAAISDIGGATVKDSTLTAGLGLSPSKPGTTARRLTIHATRGLYMIGSKLNVANVLITPYPEPTPGYTFVGAYVAGGNGGENASLSIADATIVGLGVGTAGTGLYASANNGAAAGTVNVDAHGVLVDGVATSVYRWGKSATQPANLTVDYSAYDAARINSSGNGSISAGAGDLTGGVDPRFVDPVAGDYRLSFESPLLDAGPPMLPLAEDDPDLSGRSRVRDSDGNGSAVRDIGAYEYQRLAPVPALTVEPPAGAPGEALGFDSAGSVDPDGDPVSYGWSFGDGSEASGATAAHAYASEGVFAPSLTVTDATGLSATATGSVSVAVPPLTGGRSGGAGSAPALTHLRQSARRWLPAGAGKRAAGAPVGTTFRFRLSAAARVRFAFARRVGKRWIRAGALVRGAAAGADKVRFRGRLSATRRLRPGRYRVTVVASDAAGRSAPRSLRFRVL